MLNNEFIVEILGLTVVCPPILLVAILGCSSLLGRPPSEAMVSCSVYAAIATSLLAAILTLSGMLVTGLRHVPVELGHWIELPHYHFAVKFVFDRLSMPLVILSLVLCGTISAFASRYLHRDRGFNRFYLLFALFVVGMVIASLAGTIETLFAGWELVGLSSALLVAFHLERPSPVRNGQRVWTVYRISDAALLVAAVVMHHLVGEGDFDHLLASSSWPDGVPQLESQQALWIGLLVLVAAAGKSALVPFSGWLPRAMEGPTPSSAVFYGALSVHLGAFLLLRLAPLITVSLPLQITVVTLGLVTALYAAIVVRVQTDIKSVLAFASLTQVGLIVAEIGLGLRYLALLHILGNACLRTLQFVRAPSLLLDRHSLLNALGAKGLTPNRTWEHLLPKKLQLRLYRLGLERGYLDAWLADGAAQLFLRTVKQCDAMERWWLRLLAGNSSAADKRVDIAQPMVSVLE